MSKLIILRGPSSVGKSTIANYLHNFGTDNTVLLPKDVFAIDIIKDNPKLYKPMLRALEKTAQEFLATDSTVIIEGAMYQQHWIDMLERLSKVADETFVFFLQAKLSTVIDRSGQRKKKRALAEEKVAELHPGAQPTGWPNEVVIDTENIGSDQIAKHIAEQCGIKLDETQEKATWFSYSFHPDWSNLKN